MRVEFFADILLILLVSSVIAVILGLVNRGKKKNFREDDTPNVELGEENQKDSAKDH
jgi:hypothetical protein